VAERRTTKRVILHREEIDRLARFPRLDDLLNRFELLDPEGFHGRREVDEHDTMFGLLCFP
jgi:hypothetical protein